MVLFIYTNVVFKICFFIWKDEIPLVLKKLALLLFCLLNIRTDVSILSRFRWFCLEDWLSYFWPFFWGTQTFKWSSAAVIRSSIKILRWHPCLIILLLLRLHLLLGSKLCFDWLCLPSLLCVICQVDLWTGLDCLLISPIVWARVDVVIVTIIYKCTVAVIKKCFRTSSGSTVAPRNRLCVFVPLINFFC